MALTHSVSSYPPPRLRRAQAFPTEFAASASMSSRPAGRRSSASATAETAGARVAKAASVESRRAALGDLTNVVGGRSGAADAKSSSSNSVAYVKKGSSASLPNVNRKVASATKPTFDRFERAISHHGNALKKENVSRPSVPLLAPHGS